MVLVLSSSNNMPMLYPIHLSSTSSGSVSSSLSTTNVLTDTELYFSFMVCVNCHQTNYLVIGVSVES